MDLEGIREAWVQDSGRYDRVVSPSDLSDNGADAIINRAIRFLDMRLGEGPPLERRFIDVNLIANDWFVKVLDARVVNDVWCADPSTGTRWRLQPVDHIRIRTLYPDGLSNATSGPPVYWALNKGNLSDLNKNTDFSDATDHEDTFRDSDAKVGYTGIIIGPPMDSALTVSVWGEFFSPALVEDEDTNWWTVCHERTVMEACSYIEEVILRNRQGQADWLLSIDMTLEQIRNAYYDQGAANVTNYVEV